MPDFELSVEQKMLRETVRKFIENEVVPRERNLDIEAFELPKESLATLQEKAKQLGLWCLSTPVKFGGSGLTTFNLCLILEEAVQHRLGVHTPGAGAFGQDPPNVLFKGTKEQIHKYVLPTVQGGLKWFWSITEPTGGSDPARSIRTVARREGNEWVIHGEKLFATMADRADYGIVFARTRTDQGRSGISAFIVSTESNGMSIQKVPVLRDRWTTSIYFDNYRVPLDNLLGEEGQGFKLTQEYLVPTRLGVAAKAVGSAKKSLELAIDYARIRETFGKPLAQRQGIQWLLVDAEVNVRAGRWLVWEAALKHDRGELALTESSIAKLFCTEMAFKAVDQAIQIHGGMGVTKEMPLERWFRDIRVMRIVDGPSEIHRHVIARELLGRI